MLELATSRKRERIAARCRGTHELRADSTPLLIVAARLPLHPLQPRLDELTVPRQAGDELGGEVDGRVIHEVHHCRICLLGRKDTQLTSVGRTTSVPRKD